MEEEWEKGIVLVTRTRPDYRYGNLICLDRPPPLDQVAALKGQYAGVASQLSLPAAACVAWELQDTQQVAAYEAVGHRGGFHCQPAEVLIYDRLLAQTALDAALVVRPIEGDEDWATVAAMATPEDGFAEDGLRTWLLEQRRQLVTAGRGRWWGAWADGQLVASCGEFNDGRTARLDQLLVASDVRRRGFGSMLIAGMSARLAREYEPIVMEPAHRDWRSRMYRRLGYGCVGFTLTLVEAATSELGIDHSLSAGPSTS